ncbi:MAG: S41 family peptidase [Candidatus Cloacimonetes bacterium]|nr:S41 family peptidase [Candidatus Cloacimonadota bacterium]
METDHWKEILQKKPAPQTSDPKTEAETQKDAEPEENTESQDVEPTPVPDAETEEFEPAEAKEKEDEKPRLTIEWRDLEKRYFKIITTSNGYLTPLKMISDTTFYYFQENYFSEIPSYLKKANIYGGNIKEEFNFGKNTMAFKLVGSTIYYTSSGALKSYNYVTAKRGEINCSFDYSYDLSVLNRRVFEQVWGAFGQNFYDPDMHGQSWEKLYERYRPYVEKVVTIDDLSYIIDEMIGDVNASHTGFYPRTDKEQKYKRIASLGMDFDLSAELDEGLKIKNVFPRHRIYDFYKIRPNDLLLEIDGTRITKYTSVDSLLADKVGKRIRLKIKQGDSILDAQVDGIELWDQRELWYLKKTEDNRNKVSELSSGKLGYVHIPSMGYEDYTKFINDVFRFNSDKAGLVIDVRGNTGGWIHDLLVSFLSQRPYAYSTSRRMGFEKRIEPRRLWDKPTIVLVDENSFSDGEIFPTVYKELKLGKVVGYPSSGAVIGTSPYYLIDGSEMRMPGSGWFKLDGSNMEGTGAMPDIVIDHTPNDILAERDNQLQTAVEELLKEL